MEAALPVPLCVPPPLPSPPSPRWAGVGTMFRRKRKDCGEKNGNKICTILPQRLKGFCWNVWESFYLEITFHPNKAHLIQQLEQGCTTLFLEIYYPVGFHSNPNKAHLIQQLEQSCPTLFLEIYHPVGFHSNPNKAHLIQQLEQSCPTLFLEIYRPVGFHSNPNKAHLIQQLE